MQVDFHTAACLCIVSILIGIFIGYQMHPDPLWDIAKDDRGCIIQWDDGSYSYKSRAVHLGTLQPGESKTITLDIQPEETTP